MTFCGYHGSTDAVDVFTGFIRPISPDVETTNWFPTPLYTHVDEASPPNDSDLIQSTTSTAVWPSFNTFDCELTLDTPSAEPAPGDRQLITLRTRLEIIEDTPGGTGNADFTYSLVQGTTVIAFSTHSESTVNNWQTVTYDLTEGEVNSITDYSDLRFRLSVNIGHNSGFPDVLAECSWVEVEFSQRP